MPMIVPQSVERITTNHEQITRSVDQLAAVRSR